MPTTGANAGKILKRTNPGTIQDKFLVGYQGWFTCPNDGPPISEGHHGWLHWLNQPLTPPANGRPNTDLWPDTSAYDPSELYPVEGLTHRDGSPAKVFSSRDPRTVRRHFHWMAEHSVDGAFLQRFVGQVDPEDPLNRDTRYGGVLRLRDEVGRRVREAAEAEGRVWAIMYDVSGVPADSLLRIITHDIAHLIHTECIFDSPAYLRERGRPVLAIWGLGLSDSPVSPTIARAVIAALRAAADMYVFAGVPAHWRTPGAGDAHADPSWADVWLGAEGAVDAVSPWSVGRYSTKTDVEAWAAERWAGDAELVAKHNEGIELSGRAGRKVDYVPVVLPGGSGFNLSEGKWAFNGIKRDGGKFLWAQIFHAKRLKGVRSMYGAMWDEYDEGTAFLPVVEKKRLLPESETWSFLALDEDGYDLPSDWYMRIAGFAAEGLRSERRIHDSFPSKELQDYWGTRPRYEEGVSAASSSSSSSAAGSSSAAVSAAGATSAVGGAASAGAGSGKTEEETEAQREAKAQFDAWAEEQRLKEAEGEDAPPPAYSLEDEGPAVQETVVPQQAPGAVPQQSAAPQPVQQQNVAPQPQQQFTPPVQQQQQQRYVAPQPQPGYAGDAAVVALAGEFAHQHIASPPPQHPSHRGSGQGIGRAGVGAGGGVGIGGTAERPPLHPAHPQAGRVGSQNSIHAGGAGRENFGAGGRVGSPEVQGQGSGQWAGAGAQGGYQQAQQQHAGGSAGSAGGAYPAQEGYQQPQNTGGSAESAGRAYPPQGAYQQQGYQPGGSAVQVAYQQAQHTGESAGSSSQYQQNPQRQGSYPAPGAYQQQQHTGGSASYQAQQLQHTGGSAGGSAAYPAQAAPHQQYAQSYESQRPGSSTGPAPHAPHGAYQQAQHTDGSAGAQGGYQQQGYQQAQHTGGSAGSSGYPGQGAYQKQQHTGGSGAYQHQQHTGGSAGSASYPSQGGPQYQPQPQPQQQHTGGSGSYTPTAARPPSTYPGQAVGYAATAGPSLVHSASLSARPTSYPEQGGGGYASGAALGHSASLSARPPASMYPGASPHGLSPRPDSAPRPTTPGYAYPTSPPPHGGPLLGSHASLAPRPASARPTTPGYAGQTGPPHGPPQQPSYPNQFPSPNGPPAASYPGSSYNSSPSLPSPDIPKPAFPPGPQYGGGAPYQPPRPGPQAPYAGHSFPSPQQGPSYPASPPPPGSPPYPPAGPLFPQGGSDNGYFYQQPPQPQLPSAGYSPPQPDMHNYAQQPQGPWVPGGGTPPQMPHRPGSLPQPGYGQPAAYGFPTAQTAPLSGPLGFATTSMDKLVGRRTREQLEGTVETLAQSSTKLLNKFRL